MSMAIIFSDRSQVRSDAYLTDRTPGHAFVYVCAVQEMGSIFSGVPSFSATSAIESDLGELSLSV